MKHHLKYLLLFYVLVTSACSSEVDRALDRLDAAMDAKEGYRLEFLDRMASVRALYECAESDSLKWEYSHTLFNEFMHYSLDSAYTYLALMESFCTSDRQEARNDMAQVRVLYQKHMNNLAVETFSMIDKETICDDELRREYLSCALYLYKGLDQDSLDFYREAYLAEDTVSVFGQKIHAQYLRDKGELQRALNILLACDGTEDNYHDKASTVYNIGMLYDQLGDKDRKKIYLARSGVYDFLAPNRDYMSIYQLALELYEDGDLKRANRYIESNLMDVIGGGFDHRVINSGKAHKVINEAIAEIERERTRLVSAALALVTALLLAISFMLYYSRKQSRRLKESHKLLSAANSQIKKQNVKLTEANLIKDNYVFRYMDLSIKYIERMEQMRHDIRHELKEQPVETVIKNLRSPSEIYAEYKRCYQIFDETFLSIFPDFREKVNELLREECRFPISKEKSLATEIRVLAVLRLGISESGKIATFLKCAPATIYTYRTKMRNAAICGKEEFEDKVRHL